MNGSNDNQKRKVPALLGFITYLGIILLSFVFAVGFGHQESLQLLLIYPLLLPLGLGFLSGQDPNRFLIVISYIGFIFFLVAFLFARSWSRYLLLCILFSCLVLLSLAGCRNIHGPE